MFAGGVAFLGLGIGFQLLVRIEVHAGARRAPESPQITTCGPLVPERCPVRDCHCPERSHTHANGRGPAHR